MMESGRYARFLTVTIVSIQCFLVASTVAFLVEIKPPGDKFVKSISSNAVFSCHVTGVEEGDATDVKIQWFDKDSRPIPEILSNRIYVERGSDQTRKLYLTSIEENDAGKYSCSATVNGVRKEKSVELFNFKEITFDHVPNPQHPELHCNARIECQVTGSPTPTISWRFNGNPIEGGGRYIKEANGLMIKNITRTDNGNYTCRAEVEADGRYDERTIVVAVHIGPSPVEGPGNIEGIEGQKIALSCKSGGLPSPKYEFFKRNRARDWTVVLPSDRVHIDSDFGRVEFRNLTKEDEGAYLCRALNDVGSKENEGSVKVFVPPKVQEMSNRTVDEGSGAVIVCRSVGDPAPVITFQKIGNAEAFKNGSNEGGRISVEPRGHGHYELRIKKVTPGDMGSYVCRVHNAVGQNAATGSLRVRYKPRFTQPDDDQQPSPAVVYSWAGRVHNMSCSPEGEPTPTVNWRRVDTNLVNNDTFHVFSVAGTSSLQVRVKEADQSWIYGDYVCRAQNSLGHTDFKLALSRATVPGAPQGVTIKETLPNLVLLAIEPPKENGGMRLVGYRVEFDNKVQDFSIVDLDDRTGNKSQTSSDYMRIENLRPATNYTFRIRAKNEVGVGNKLETVVTTGDISRPSPIHLTSPGHGRDSGRYKITWEKPRTGGKPIKEYEIRYKKVRLLAGGKDQSEEDWKIERHFDSSDQPKLDYVLDGLHPNTQYKLEVLARNEIGSSRPEKTFYFKTSALPQMGQSSRAGTVFLAPSSSSSRLLVVVAGVSILVNLWTGLLAA